MFLYLAVDYARNPELRQRFADNPEEVLREYLSDDQRAGLEGWSRDHLERALHDGVDALIRALEAHREIALLSDTRLWAAPPEPQPKSISPATVGAGQPVPLTIYGESFAPKVAVAFGSPGKEVPLSGATVNSTGTQITGKATFEVSGVYTCVVTNNPDTPEASSGSLAQAITVT